MDRIYEIYHFLAESTADPADFSKLIAFLIHQLGFTKRFFLKINEQIGYSHDDFKSSDKSRQIIGFQAI